MAETADWIHAREAASRLAVKLETLYAYASRGLVQSVPRVGGRGRLYNRHEIERLRARRDARSGHGAVAASALRWGEPTLDTAVAEIRADGPYYRDHQARSLCERDVGFETVAELLWSGRLTPAARWPLPTLTFTLPRRPRAPAASAYLAAVVSAAALRDERRYGASDLDEHARARRLIALLASIVGGRKIAAARLRQNRCIAELVLASFGMATSAAHVRAVDHALILCAEHELNASTFAARVTASAGADLYACLGAALHALSGLRHGGGPSRVEALLEELARPARAHALVRERLALGRSLPGFGHPLYAAGDPRAHALFALAHALPRSSDALSRLDALVRAMRKAQQPEPNLDLGLVAVSLALGMPRGAAAALFAIGRTAGWVAHALEQRAQGYLLRPRARYVAPRAG